jgi:hypothetical protein
MGRGGSPRTSIKRGDAAPTDEGNPKPIASLDPPDYIFLRYCPPTSYNASVICPRLQHLTVSINSAKMLSPEQGHLLEPGQGLGGLIRVEAVEWKSFNRLSWDSFSSVNRSMHWPHVGAVGGRC